MPARPSRHPTGRASAADRAILGTLLDDLFASREQARQAGNAVASQAIKILMNSFYGVLGTSACRFFDPRLANAITSFGKHFLLWAKGWIEERGLQVLYGDTDSLFVAGAAALDGPRLAAELNAELAAYVAATWRLPSYLEMEFETLFERLFLPAVRGGGRGATKRYVGSGAGGSCTSPAWRWYGATGPRWPTRCSASCTGGCSPANRSKPTCGR